MKGIKLIIIFYLGFVVNSKAQTLHGSVVSEKGEKLPGANIILKGTTNGTITDIEGKFKLDYTEDDTKTIIISFVGYHTDTLNFTGEQHLKAVLKENVSIEGVEITGSASSVDFLSPKQTEIITSKELLKAACCNLSESFETNASVDVSISDAVSGAKKIRFLGLSGRYTQIMRENIPNIRGLMSIYGLTYIPGTWIQSIDVGKGAGSVANGYESMTGQLNVELKKPENSEKLYFNAYGNELGRSELSINLAKKVNDKLSTALFIHGGMLNSEIDRNDDGFRDLPLYKQVNLLNRWKYDGDRVKSQIGINLLKDDKLGGQTGFKSGDDHLTSPLYGLQVDTERAEVFGKIGVIFPATPYRGFGFIYSASYHNQDAFFGRTSYNGTQKTVYTNLIYQSIIGNTNHKFKTGFSYLLDDYDEVYNDSTFARQESVPGAFFEYTTTPIDKLIVVAGGRADRHNLYGTFFTPRLHIKYDLGEQTALRLSTGRGFRVPNVIAEHTHTLVSSRTLKVEAPIKPEITWNYGINLQHGFEIANREAGINFDFYRTTFKDRLVMDMDANPNTIIFYNLRGESYANSFQVEGSYRPFERFDVKMAYKYYDVKTTINNQLRQQPFVSKNRLFLNLGYATKFEKWRFDLTTQWYSSRRIPDTIEKSAGFRAASTSPSFTTINAQVTKAYRKWEWYLGGENLSNFKQDNPIIDPQNPFGNNFDASLVWGPIVGRVVYAGIRFDIE